MSTETEIKGKKRTHDEDDESNGAAETTTYQEIVTTCYFTSRCISYLSFFLFSSCLID